MKQETTHVPIRMCVACRRRAPQHTLLRLALADGGVTVQLRDRSGRGAYVCPNSRCLTRVVKQGYLNRALRAPLGPVRPENIITTAITKIEARLARLDEAHGNENEVKALCALKGRLDGLVPRSPHPRSRTTADRSYHPVVSTTPPSKRPKGGPAGSWLR